MANKINKSNVPIDRFLRSDAEPNVLTFEIDGQETTWEYRDLSWYEKNQCIAKATVIIPDKDGNTTFSFDPAIYYSEALLKMITAAPLPITPQSIQNLRSEIGDRLVSIVPVPLDGGNRDEIKKD